MPLQLIVGLITTLASTLMTVLTGQNVVSQKLASLVDSLVAAGATLFNSFTSGGTPTNELTTVLATLQTELTAAKQDTSIDPVILDQIAEADKVVSAAIAGFQQGEQTTDPSTLTPLPPVDDTTTTPPAEPPANPPAPAEHPAG
jgi:hypothetical protein